MREAAKKFEFERAATLRDRIRALRQREVSEIPMAGPLEAVDDLHAGAAECETSSGTRGIEESSPRIAPDVETAEASKAGAVANRPSRSRR
jgi:hypothetical protein